MTSEKLIKARVANPCLLFHAFAKNNQYKKKYICKLYLIIKLYVFFSIKYGKVIFKKWKLHLLAKTVGSEISSFIKS